MKPMILEAVFTRLSILLSAQPKLGAFGKFLREIRENFSQDLAVATLRLIEFEAPMYNCHTFSAFHGVRASGLTALISA